MVCILYLDKSIARSLRVFVKKYLYSIAFLPNYVAFKVTKVQCLPPIHKGPKFELELAETIFFREIIFS